VSFRSGVWGVHRSPRSRALITFLKKRAKRIEGERLFRLAIFDTPDHVSLMQHPWYVVTAEGRVLVPRPRSHARAHVFEYGVFFFLQHPFFFFSGSIHFSICHTKIAVGVSLMLARNTGGWMRGFEARKSRISMRE